MKKTEHLIKLSKEEKIEAIEKIKRYLSDEFDINAGNLQSEIFLEFITEHIGKYYYNHGITDSMKVLNDKIEDLYLLMKD